MALTATQAQAQVWGGAGSTTATTDYNLGTNWSTGTAPVSAGETATFASTGAASVAVTSGPVGPQSWTFNANSQFYVVTGQAVNFVAGVTNNASVGQEISIANNLTGTTLSQAGNSTLKLSGTDTFTAVNVSDGTLVNSGNLTSDVTNNAIYTNSGTLTGHLNNFGIASNAGVISNGVTNGGTFAQTAGTVSNGLTNVSIVIASGGTINGAINNSAGDFNVTGNFAAGGTFDNNTATNLQVANGAVFTPAGLVTNNGAVTVLFNGALLATTNGIANNSTGTIVNTGTINGPVQNSGAVTNNAGGIFFSNLTNSAVGTVSNSGTWNGDLVSNANTAAGAINNIGTWNGEANNNAGTVLNSGTWNTTAGFINADTLHSMGTITGGLTNTKSANLRGTISGAIVNQGLGIFTVTGALTGNGPFNNSGTAQLRVSGGDYSGVGNVTNTSTAAAGIQVTVGRTLTANSVFNAAGATIDNLGTIVTNSMVNDGVMTGSYVFANGTLAGVGSSQNVNMFGGTFAPGDGTPGSSMTVMGGLLASGGVYQAQVNPAAASFATVVGPATLNGSIVQAVFAPGSYAARQYTILTATALSGTFSPVVSNLNLGSNFQTSLSYDAAHVYLNLSLNFVPTPGNQFNGNQQNFANAITDLFNNNVGIPLAFGTLTPAGLTQVSGETATGSQQTTFDAMTQFTGVMTDPFIAGRGDVGSYSPGASSYTDEAGPAGAHAAIWRKATVPAAPFTRHWSVWAAGFGGSQTTDGNATLGSNIATSRIGAVAVGADYRISPDTLAGFAVAGGGTNFSVANGGSGRSDLFQAGAFIRHNAGPAYISAALAYGWQDITTDRTVTVAGLDRLRARFNANAWSGRIEGGYRFVARGIGLTPYAAGQFTVFDLPAYAEAAVSGANTFALAYGAKNVTASRGELGLRIDKSLAIADAVLTLRARLAWAHDYQPSRNILATFQTLPGASFIVDGAAQSHDAALTTVSAELKWLNGVSLAATFDGEFSGVTRSYAGKGVAHYAW